MVQDIKLDFDKGIIIKNNSPIIVKDNNEYIQNIKIEAITTEGDLWHNKEFGWSLVDFMHRSINEMLKIELTQRIRNKLNNRPYIDINTISVELKEFTDYFLLHVYFNLLYEDVNFAIRIDRIKAEVLLDG